MTAFAELQTDAETRISQTLALIADMRQYQLQEDEEFRLEEIEAELRGEAA